MKRGERGKVEAKVEICWGSIKAWMEGGRRGEVEGRVKECRSVESSYSERVKEGMLEESVELVAGRGGGGVGNKEGTEIVKTSKMKGCVGGRSVGVEHNKKKEMEVSPVHPLAPQMFMIKSSFHSHSHTPLLTFA